MRDSQRSKVYAWERAQNPGRVIWTQTMTLEEVEAFIKPIWRGERGRYGKKAYQAAPSVVAQHGGNARAFGDYKMTFGKNCRNAYVALHELAHCLNRTRSGHDARFVGILIGLLARHPGRDADTLLATAYEAGVEVDTRSIGTVPVFPWHLRVEPLLPCTAMEAAVELGVSYRVIHGSALQLIKRGVARWRGKTLVRVSPAASVATVVQP
jgi:hypothetical protein